MSYNDKILKTLEELEAKGNSEQEASDILAGLMNDCSMTIQHGWYSKEYTRELISRKNTALVELRKFTYGRDIIKQEQKICK